MSARREDDGEQISLGDFLSGKECQKPKDSRVKFQHDPY